MGDNRENREKLEKISYFPVWGSNMYFKDGTSVQKNSSYLKKQSAAVLNGIAAHFVSTYSLIFKYKFTHITIICKLSAYCFFYMHFFIFWLVRDRPYCVRSRCRSPPNQSVFYFLKTDWRKKNEKL